MATNDPSSGGTSNGTGARAQAPDVIHHATRMAAEATAFGRAISATGSQLSSGLDLGNRVQRNPIGSVLVAAGLGYILGGGLFSPVTKKALSIGLRLAFVPFLKGQIAALTGTAQQAGEPL